MQPSPIRSGIPKLTSSPTKTKLPTPSRNLSRSTSAASSAASTTNQLTAPPSDDNPPNTPSSPITPIKPLKKKPSPSPSPSTPSSIPSYAKPTLAIQSRLPSTSTTRPAPAPRSILKRASGGGLSPRPTDSSSPLPSRAAAITERLTSTTPIPYTANGHSRHSSGSKGGSGGGGGGGGMRHVRGKASNGGGSTSSKIPTLDWGGSSGGSQHSSRQPSMNQVDAQVTGEGMREGEGEEGGLAAILASAKQAQAMVAEVEEEEAKARPPVPTRRGHSRGASVIPTSTPYSPLPPDPLDAEHDLLDDIDVDTDLDAAFDEAPLPLPADDPVEINSAPVQRDERGVYEGGEVVEGDEEQGGGYEEQKEAEETGEAVEPETTEEVETAEEGQLRTSNAESKEEEVIDDLPLPADDQPLLAVVEVVSPVATAATADEAEEDEVEEVNQAEPPSDAEPTVAHPSAPASDPPTPPPSNPPHSSPLDTAAPSEVQPLAADAAATTPRDSVSSDAGVVDGSFNTIIIDRDPMDKLDPEAPTPVTRTPNVTISADDTAGRGAESSAREAAEALVDADLLPTRTPAVSNAVPSSATSEPLLTDAADVAVVSTHLPALAVGSATNPLPPITATPTTPTKQVAFREEVSAVDAPHSLEDLLDDSSDLFGDDPTTFPKTPDRLSIADEPTVTPTPITAPSTSTPTPTPLPPPSESPLTKLREAETARRAEEDRKAQQSTLASEAAARRAALDAAEEAKYQREKEQLAQAKVAVQLEESRRQLFAAFDAGLQVTKLGKKGSPRLTRVYVRQEGGAGGRWVVGWDSRKKAAGDAQIPLSDARCVVGADEGMFLHRKYAGRFEEVKGRCVSVVSPVRGLDVVLNEEVEVNQWIAMMRLLNVKVVEN